MIGFTKNIINIIIKIYLKKIFLKYLANILSYIYLFIYCRVCVCVYVWYMGMGMLWHMYGGQITT